MKIRWRVLCQLGLSGLLILAFAVTTVIGIMFVEKFVPTSMTFEIQNRGNEAICEIRVLAGKGRSAGLTDEVWMIPKLNPGENIVGKKWNRNREAWGLRYSICGREELERSLGIYLNTPSHLRITIVGGNVREEYVSDP